MQNIIERKFLRYVILFIGVLSISTAAIFIRFAQEEAGSLVIAAARMIISVLPLIPLVFLSHRQELQRISRRNLMLSMLAGLLLALHFATWITSLEYTSIASSVVIVCTTPIWVTLFGAIFYQERVNKFILLGIIFAMTGGIIVALSSICSLTRFNLVCNFVSIGTDPTSITGNLLAFFGALFAAGYLIVGRTVRNSVSLIPYAFMVYLSAAVILAMLVVLFRQPLQMYSANTYIFLILLAVFPQLIGHSTLNWALKYLSTTYVSIAQMGEPIGSTILAMIIFREIPTPFKVIGGLFILAGIYIASIQPRTT